ncbi:MAG: LuxR C-terminal-related transcriptional regulator [Chloroflexota bacterium]
MVVPRSAHEHRSALHDWRVAAIPRASIVTGPRGAETPFVGRQALLGLVEDTLAGAAQGRHVVVRLVGEAGIGKTRLLREVARRGAHRGLPVSWLDDASPPLAGGGTLGALAVVPTAASRAAVRSPRLVLADLAGRSDRLREVADLVLDDAASAPTVVFLAVGSVGAAVAADWRVLAHLARQRLFHEIVVPPLADPEVHELAALVLGGPLHPRLRQTIGALSDGNPLHVEAVAGDLQRRGLIRLQQGTAYLLGEVADSYVPSAFAAARAVELDALEPAVVATLCAAAVLGPAVQFDVLAAALPLSDGLLLGHLEAGLAHGILREAPDPAADFRFTHELVRRVLYRRLSQLRRRALHEAMAEALERRAAPTGPDCPERGDPSAALAHHVARGADPGRALDSVLRAQEQAEQECRWDDAIRAGRRALDLARQSRAADLALQVALLERLGALYFGQAETFAAGACWREALLLCAQTGRWMRRAALAARLAALGSSWYAVGDAEAALADALQADGTGDDDGGDALAIAGWRSDAHYELGLAYQRQGRLARALGHLQTACHTVAPTDGPRRVLAQASLARALVTAGRPHEALALLAAARDSLPPAPPSAALSGARADHLRDPRRVRCVALGELARVHAALGRLDEAAELAESVIELERTLGILGGRGQRVLAQVELGRGRPERAIEVLAERTRASAAGSLSAHRVLDLLLLAEAHLASGAVDRAVEAATDGVHLCGRTRADEHLAGVQSVLARGLLARGEVGAAAAVLAAARQTLAATGAEAYRPALLAAEDAYRAAGAPAARDPAPAPTRGAPAPHPGGLGATSDGPRVRSRATALTAREREVLAVMAEGRTNRQIARVLILSEKTVKRHLSNLFAKLGVGTRAAAVRRGFETGVL